ncbi:MAG: hypothetical protein AAGE59_14810 [Cyanobacteria bacterium P01_F01_bin.86]
MSRLQFRLRVKELIQKFNIGFDLERYPYELSGGQQQMVWDVKSLMLDESELG